MTSAGVSVGDPLSASCSSPRGWVESGQKEIVTPALQGESIGEDWGIFSSLHRCDIDAKCPSYLVSHIDDMTHSAHLGTRTEECNVLVMESSSVDAIAVVEPW